MVDLERVICLLLAMQDPGVHLLNAGFFLTLQTKAISDNYIITV